MTPEEIDNIFSYHKPKDDVPYAIPQTKRYEEIRDRARDLAHYLNFACPDSREKSLAFTHLQNVVMWANAAIAINE